jgi:hypothetical protein
MREWINLCEDQDLLSIWDLLNHYKAEEARLRFHDAVLPWINRNAVTCINRASRNRKFQTSSRIVFFANEIMKVQNWATPFATPEMFEAALDTPIKLWRGGGGVYDPQHIDRQNRDWVSFTARRDRCATFTTYDGTHATRGYVLPKRKGAWWIVELTLPLRDILLYLDGGNDDEVIVSKTMAAQARVVETGGE